MRKFLLIGAACIGLAACSNTPASPTMVANMQTGVTVLDAALSAAIASGKLGTNDAKNVANAKADLDAAWAAYQAGGDTQTAALTAAIAAATALLTQYGLHA